MIQSKTYHYIDEKVFQKSFHIMIPFRWRDLQIHFVEIEYFSVILSVSLSFQRIIHLVIDLNEGIEAFGFYCGELCDPRQSHRLTLSFIFSSLTNSKPIVVFSTVIPKRQWLTLINIPLARSSSLSNASLYTGMNFNLVFRDNVNTLSVYWKFSYCYAC